MAAKALNAGLAILSKRFRRSVLASDVSHRAVRLPFLQERPNNQVLRSESGLRLLLHLAPVSVSAGGGAFCLAQICWFPPVERFPIALLFLYDMLLLETFQEPCKWKHRNGIASKIKTHVLHLFLNVASRSERQTHTF
jgi:hypothetical protein